MTTKKKGFDADEFRAHMETLTEEQLNQLLSIIKEVNENEKKRDRNNKPSADSVIIHGESKAVMHG